MRTLGSALLGGAFVLAVLAGSATAGSLPVVDEFASLPQLGADELAQQRGGTETETSPSPDVLGNGAGLEGSVTTQINGNVTNGAISGNSLNNVRGISTVMYNTGTNVVFNSATQVNINLK